MKIDYEDRDQTTVMSLNGDLTGDDVERFKRATVQRLDDRARDFILDCEHLDAIDSQGLESLLWLQDQCAERLGQMRLVACNENVTKIFEMTRLADQLACHETEDSAISSLF
jgi:anti-anti-sigma factor